MMHLGDEPVQMPNSWYEPPEPLDLQAIEDAYDDYQEMLDDDRRHGID